MLTCIARSKQTSGEMSVDQPGEKHNSNVTPNKQTVKNLSSQIKDMALKASGAYRHCAPCTTEPAPQQRRSRSFRAGGEPDSVAPDKFRWSYRRTGSFNSSSTAGRRELEARLKGISSGEGTPASASGRRVDPIVFVEESEPKEWVAQVEPGVLITFLSLPGGGNDLKRIRFSRETFNKWQAQRWWAENCEKVMELYNVQRLNRQAFPLPTTPRSEGGSSSSKIESIQNSPVTPPLGREPLPRTFFRQVGNGISYSSSDSLDHQSTHSRSNYDSCGVSSTPKLSSISGAKTETSSMDASIRTSSSRDADRSGEISISNASDLESEWVEQDEPGVYITIRALPDGKRELRRRPMESDIALSEKGGNYDVVVQVQVPGTEGKSVSGSTGDSSMMEDLSRVQMPLFLNTMTAPVLAGGPGPSQDLSGKQSLGSPSLQNSLTKSSLLKLKSRIVEPLYSSTLKPGEEISQATDVASPNAASQPVKAKPGTPKTSTPPGDDDEDADDDMVYETESFKMFKFKRGKKVRVMFLVEWVAFVCIMSVLVSSLTVNRLKGFHIWSLELWKWCVQVLVIFCGRLLTGWVTNFLVYLIGKNFLLKKKVLYFLFGLKNSFRVVIWLALILLAWVLLIDRGVKRSEETTTVLYYITRGIVSTLVGAVIWMVKTLFVKLVASSFHVRTYFDRIQESIFHQYILQALSGTPMEKNDGSVSRKRLSFSRVKTRKQKKQEEVIHVDKLYKIRREKVSAWTMGGLVNVIRKSGMPNISVVREEEEEGKAPKEITSEVEAKDAANRIFRNVARHGHKYINENDLLRFMPEEDVVNVFSLFEGAAESRKITKSSFRNWVVRVCNERKNLVLSLNDTKTAIKELNKIASGLILVVIAIVWLLLMEVTTTKILVFISSQVLLVVFMFGNTVRTVFEAIIFVFVIHPFDIGDRCVVDGKQMVVDEMNILTTVFLKPDNEKVYYPNAVLATTPISNFNRSPEMGDSVDFALDFSTSVEKIADLKAKIKAYLESRPQEWRPGHSLIFKEIVDVNKLNMALYVSHTINFQNSGERGSRRSDLVFALKKIFEEIGIKYHLLPQEVQISYL
ncbi:mechanosensitive ion channel protein 10-like [Dorcoceras hygrometricum]|uniref:Mechanosensitive ion channel protein 10-like n=1 Tax=Dorcoceras hygrometricum TaxID=472368 RepID=A0A2Z7AB98_9LAMI|nr:mechanosensitive ion channel protein 10-like [Dorcoceras hygrometricum]